MNKKQYRQGDVSLHSVNKLPKTATEVKHDGKFILAYGEVSGHVHQVIGDFKIYKDEEGRLYLKNDRSVQLVHYDTKRKTKAEHNTEVITKGLRVVVYEERYNPFTEELEKVVD